MSTKVMTIWAEQKIQDKFKSEWYLYNAKNKKKITQGEFLKKLLDNFRED